MVRVDREVVRQRLERMLFELDEIERKLPTAYEQYAALDAEDRRYELEHRMYIALQAMLDIAAHLAVVGDVRHLESYRDAIAALADLGVLERDVADRLKRAPGLRNALAHEYLNVDDEQVYLAMRDVSDLRSFAAAAWGRVEGR